MRIHIWGTRGSIAVAGKDTVKYGGNTTCAEVQAEDGATIIIDAGTGIRTLGEKYMKQEKPLEALLLITHIHWDHILGFPFFAPIYNPSTRLVIDGYERAPMGLRRIFETDMRDGFFPVHFADLQSRMEFQRKVEFEPIEIGSIKVESISLQHPHGGLGFKFTADGKTLVFLTDNELTPEGWKGRKPLDYGRFCRDADLLIHDSQYTPEQIPDRRWWGHSDYLSVLELAREAGAPRLLLTHHDHGHTDDIMDGIVSRCKEKAQEMGLAIDVDAAREECYLV